MPKSGEIFQSLYGVDPKNLKTIEIDNIVIGKNKIDDMLQNEYDKTNKEIEKIMKKNLINF